MSVAAGATRRLRDSWSLGVLALAARLLLVWWAASRFSPAADGSYYHVVAMRIAEGHGYTWLWPDGAVSYAAHYPVGLPAMVGGLYALFGAKPLLAMLLNALFGAAMVVAVHRLLRPDKWRAVAASGALLVCFHPGLLFYTPALMTEGITAALLMIAAWLAMRLRRRDGALDARALVGWLALGLAMGGCTLVRPQSLLLAPLFAALAVRRGLRRRIGLALATLAVCLATVAPWTLRNCRRMDRCALVSVNGGWNLLIGTQPEGHGGWSALRTPDSCREVFHEAHKDSCFGREAGAYIRQHPLSWLQLMPAKLGVTFDYCGAAGWYLHESNPHAFSARAKWWLGAVELVYERLLLALALLVLIPPGGLRPRSGSGRLGRWRWWLGWACVTLGVMVCFSRAGWVAMLLLALGLLCRRTPPWRAPLWYGGTAAVLLVTAAVHAVFFGAGRYQLVLLPWIAVLAPLGATRVLGQLRSVRERVRGAAG